MIIVDIFYTVFVRFFLRYWFYCLYINITGVGSP